MINAVEYIRHFISAEGRNLGNGILKVDALLNHQILPEVMQAFGQEFARRFASQRVTRILTAEISGIAPAVMTGLALNVPVVYARKKRPVTMSGPVYLAEAASRTKGGTNELVVSAEFLLAGDRVLVIDDFLARGQTSAALLNLVREAGATPVGLGCVVEKAFEGGRAYLHANGFAEVSVESLASILSMDDGKIVLAD
ncbi:xanthine phosphoribosyltransferase [Cerasicoccus arenae]|uniref:Xanthine phosphoribosyltransferase n=1 Tax=Cerasicoccus arenae TaxID=424488 RepID=A0A8J3DFA1_9BACT|nr:xanthine phosphoribosyltransferase [Cerasicoccus arenae]MBK1860049.1 xanthine phosphoribosyltransferase [Cerasicoccus arenae]GHB93223.1 xanthine phosphoribosyltransferase [Cerasicoccus arenae]